MGQGKLFRQEVIENLKHKHQGAVFQNHALPHTNLAIWIFIITIGIIIFIIKAEFSEKYNISGFLNTDEGIAHIHPTQGGIITQSFIQQGQAVKAGDILFLVNTSYSDLHKELSQREFKLLQTRFKSIKKTIKQKREQLKSLKPLLQKKYITSNVYQSKIDEINNLKNSLHQTHIDMLKLKKSLVYYIFSPIDGIITNNIYKVGQYVTPSKAIINILPTNNRLHAELFVPVAKSGFIKLGAKVSIRFAAFPYLRYGAGKAKVSSISQTILTDDEEQKPLKINGPYYKVIAELDEQTIKIANHKLQLTQGMLVNGVIYGDKKKLWQWIFSPILNFYGKLQI